MSDQTIENKQIKYALAQHDLADPEGTYTLFTAKGKSEVVSLNLRCRTLAPGGTFLWLSVHLNNATPTFFITGAEGDVTKILSQVILPWHGSIMVNGLLNDIIQITTKGVAGIPYTLLIEIGYRQMEDGAYIKGGP